MSSSSSAAALALALVFWAEPALAGTYRFGPDTEVRYRGSHPAHAWEGVSRHVTGTLVLEAGRPRLPAEVRVPLRSFQSGNGSRDANALAAMKAHRHPDALYVAEGVTPEPGGRLRLAGSLHLAGVSQPLELPLAVARVGDALRFEGAFSFRLSDHRIERPRLLFAPIADRIDVSVRGSLVQTP